MVKPKSHQADFVRDFVRKFVRGLVFILFYLK